MRKFLASEKRALRATLAAVLGLVILLGGDGGSARAEDDEPLDTKIFRNILRVLGLRRGDEDNIQYRERSPLVLPPSRELPPPITSTAEQNPNWPVDPDVKQRKEAKAKRKDPNRTGDSVVEDSRVLSPDELRNDPSRARPDNRRSDAMPEARPMTPSELGYKGGLWKSLFAKDEEYTTFTGEAPRASLIEPPPGYRTPAPTQPYGVGKEKWTPKPIDRLEPVR